MPAFKTGNDAWDQGLGTLSGALFPDPSKVAQAGYYGAEQRKAQLESARLKEQFAAGHRQLGMVFGQTPGQPSYQVDPATGQPILAEPSSQAGPAPAAPPPPAAAPPSLSGMVAGGPAPGPGPAPASAPAPAPGFQGGGGEGGGPGGGWVPQTTSPAAMSQVIAQGMDKASGSNVGPPLPPASPPAPSAPPAPNTTATDGSTPAGEGAGPLHPGSLTPAGGGVKMSGPAAADGSPAPAAFNLAQYVALGVLHGLPAEQAIAQGRAVVAEWVKNGQMDQVTADNVLSGLDRPEMRVAGIQGKTSRDVAGIQAGSAANVANIQAGSASTVERMRNEELDRARGDELVKTEDNVLVPRRDLKPGQKGYDATLANTRLSAAVAPVTVQPGGAGTPTYSETTETAQKNRSPLYEPTSTDQFTAAQQQQIVNEKDPDKRRALIESFTSAQSAMPKTTTPNESVQNANIVDQRLALRLPPPVGTGAFGTGIGAGSATNSLDAASSPELAVTLQNLTDQYFTYSPDRSVRGNRVAAADAAVQQLIQEGRINPDQSANRTTSIWPGSNIPTTINKPVYNPATKTIEAKPHFRVDLIDPNTKKPVAPGAVVSVPMKSSSSLSDTVAKSTAPKGKPLGPAPPGAQDGQTGVSNTGQRGVVYQGQVYAVDGG